MRLRPCAVRFDAGTTPDSDRGSLRVSGAGSVCSLAAPCPRRARARPRPGRTDSARAGPALECRAPGSRPAGRPDARITPPRRRA